MVLITLLTSCMHALSTCVDDVASAWAPMTGQASSVAAAGISSFWSTNALVAQVLEVLADDSNFRGDVMHIIVGPAAAALGLPRRAFEAAWCAGEVPPGCTPVDTCLAGGRACRGVGCHLDSSGVGRHLTAFVSDSFSRPYTDQ